MSIPRSGQNGQYTKICIAQWSTVLTPICFLKYFQPDVADKSCVICFNWSSHIPLCVEEGSSHQKKTLRKYKTRNEKSFVYGEVFLFEVLTITLPLRWSIEEFILVGSTEK